MKTFLARILDPVVGRIAIRRPKGCRGGGDLKVRTVYVDVGNPLLEAREGIEEVVLAKEVFQDGRESKEIPAGFLHALGDIVWMVM